MSDDAPQAPQERVVRSVGTRLALTTALLVLVVSAASYVALTRYERHSLFEAKREAARAVVALLAEALSAPVVFGDDQGIRESLAFLKSNPEVLQAAVFAVGPGPRLGAELGRLAAAPALRASALPSSGSDETLHMSDAALDATRWVHDKTGARIALAVVRFSLARETQRYELLSQRALEVALALALSLTLLLLLLARVHIIKPLRTLHAAVRQLKAGGAGDPAARVKLAAHASDEIGALARDFAGMAEAIAGREAAIARQNDDMRLVLESVGQGFLVLAGDGRVRGHHSAVLESWFGPVLQGQPIWEYLRTHDRAQAEWLELAWSNIGSPHMPLELCIEQMPRRFAVHERSYEIEYRPRLTPEGGLDWMIVVISDITELVARERAEKQQRELVGSVGRLLSDRSGFLSFYQHASQLIARLVHEPERERAAMLRDLHTLKGNAGLYELSELAALCEAIETRCAAERDRPSAAERAALSRAFSPTAKVVERFAGEREPDALQLDAADHAALVRAIKDGEAPDALLARVARSHAQPARQLLGRLAEQLEVIARGLGKCPVQVKIEVEPADLRFPRASLLPLWPVLVHVLRNIADHGLESSWEREQAHKPANASVVLRAELAPDQLRLSFSDDGRGVDWERIKERASQRGLRADSEDALLASLFISGVTTRDVAGPVSGRGVGLAAVKDVVEALAGRVWLESATGRGTRLLIELPVALLAT
jgi:two-component system chemotaxis sensor kinase CheA